MDIKNADEATLDRELKRHLKAINEIKAEKDRRQQKRIKSAWDDAINSLKYFMDLSGDDIEIYDSEHTLRLSYGNFEGNSHGYIRVHDD